MDNEQLIATLWHQKNGLIMKLPKEISLEQQDKLPIKLEKKMGLVIKEDCIEIRNLIPK